jgi:hypothetical protein
MRSSDLYIYAASILWILWFCYIGGFFVWLSATYTKVCYMLAPAPPKSAKPVDMEKVAALRAVWSARDRLPGAWVEAEGEEGNKDEGQDRSVVVEGGFVLVEREG